MIEGPHGVTMPLAKGFDRRLTVARADLADIRLEGRVEAQRFVAGLPGLIAVPVADLRARPDAAEGIDTQLLKGEPVLVFDRAAGFAWIQSVIDGYVGYVEEAALGQESREPTHIIAVPRSFSYAGPDLRLPRREALSLGSRIVCVGEAMTRDTRYLCLSDGSAVIAAHCQPVNARVDTDFVAVAARLLETPYLWGGRSAFGIDCSGLVQLSLLMAGHAAPRDSDMQMHALGRPIAAAERQRGDLVFWKGHVAIMEDEVTILHASGHAMAVVRERFDEATARIAGLYGQPTGFRRPIG